MLGKASSIFNSKIYLPLKKTSYDQCFLLAITCGAVASNITKNSFKTENITAIAWQITLGNTWKDYKAANPTREQTKL